MPQPARGRPRKGSASRGSSPSRLSVALGLLWMVGTWPAFATAAPQVVEGTTVAPAASVVVDLSALAAAEALDPRRPATAKIRPPHPPRPFVPPVPLEAVPRPLPLAPPPAARPDPGRAPSPAPAQNFLALEDNGTAIPPDTTGAAGPNHLVTHLNTEVLIQDRGGTQLQRVSLDGFWSSLPGPPNAFDPRVLYDPMANRWLVFATANARTASSAYLVGTSQTGDPTGAWTLHAYDVDVAGLAWGDFPLVGFNQDWVVLTANRFTTASDAFVAAEILVLPKATLYAGSAPVATRFLVTDGGFSLAPSATYDASPGMVLVEEWNGSVNGAGVLRASALTGPASAPSLTTGVAFPAVSGFTWSFVPPGGSEFLPQLGSARKISGNDARMQTNCVRRAGSVWCTHHVFPRGAPARAAVLFWQIDAVSAVVVQQGRLDDPSGTFFFAYPSIGVNAAGDALVGYSRFSATQFASANYAFRFASDPPGLLRDEILYKAGEAPYVKTLSGATNRWGDYSATMVDPADDTSFWTIQEYAATPAGGSDRWGTWWARVVPGPPPPTPPSLTLSLNASAYTAFQTLVATATLAPGAAPPIPVDAYVVLRLANGLFFSLQLDGRLVPGIVPIVRGVLPFAFARPVFLYTFNGLEGSGSGTWLTALTVAGSGAVIGAIDQDAFSFGP